MARQGRQERIAMLTEELRGFQAAVDAVDEATSARLGINRTDGRCLDILERGGRMSAGELATAAGVTTAAITGVLDRLERAGYARRLADPGDRRRVLVELTPRAREQTRSLYGALAAAGARELARYSDAQLELIAGFLALARQLNEAHAARLAAPGEP